MAFYDCSYVGGGDGSVVQIEATDQGEAAERFVDIGIRNGGTTVEDLPILVIVGDQVFRVSGELSVDYFTEEVKA